MAACPGPVAQPLGIPTPLKRFTVIDVDDGSNQLLVNPGRAILWTIGRGLYRFIVMTGRIGQLGIDRELAGQLVPRTRVQVFTRRLAHHEPLAGVTVKCLRFW